MSGTGGAMRARLDANELVLCMGIAQARTVDIPMMAAACGFDAISVDLEHTATSLETCAMLCTAAIGFGLTPFVRVPSHDHQYLTRVIDTGAIGVIVPHVDTREQAERMVEIGKFPPVGRRSIIGPNPVNGYLPMPPAELVESLNRQSILTAMLETPEAVERADAIASVPGLDMILVGPYDLSAELGILGQFRHERFRQAIETVAAACKTHGKILGIAGIREADLLAEYAGLGLRFINAGNDVGFMMEAARARTVELRGIAAR